MRPTFRTEYKENIVKLICASLSGKDQISGIPKPLTTSFFTVEPLMKTQNPPNTFLCFIPEQDSPCETVFPRVLIYRWVMAPNRTCMDLIKFDKSRQLARINLRLRARHRPPQVPARTPRLLGFSRPLYLKGEQDEFRFPHKLYSKTTRE